MYVREDELVLKMHLPKSTYSLNKHPSLLCSDGGLVLKPEINTWALIQGNTVCTLNSVSI